MGRLKLEKKATSADTMRKWRLSEKRKVSELK